MIRSSVLHAIRGKKVRVKKKGFFLLPGQIVVLFAVVLVALLGFTALAVDGAVIYSDKRAAQNAADAASLAGAGMGAQYFENHQIRYENFACNNPTVIAGMNQGITDAINRAATNNFTIENNLTNQNGVEAICHIEDIGPYLDQYIDVKVEITVQSNTSFARLFYNGPISSVVTSIARVHPRTNLGFGYAVASMGKDCTNGGIHGNGNTTINSTNGGIFSNSCFDFVNGKLHLTVNDPGGSGCRYYSGTVDPSWCNVPIVKSPVQLVPYVLPEPDCASLPYYGASSNTGTINPGNYTTITADHGTLTLKPGLYCITGSVYNGANGNLVGNGVTLYFMNNAGYSSKANSTANLKAPTMDNPPAIRGLLMYGAPGNTGFLDISGGAGNYFQGTVYIPEGSISAGGNSSATAINAQLVAKKVSLNGTGDLYDDFDGAYNYQIPALVDLLK
jgi:Flp pilus assembly protein TadG